MSEKEQASIKELLTESIRLGAGSLGQWTPELEKSILEEFQKLTEFKDFKRNWIEDKYGRKISIVSGK
jgi:hypothetical protein